MKTVEAIIRERPDCINPAVNIPSPLDGRGGVGSGGTGGLGAALAGEDRRRKQQQLLDSLTICWYLWLMVELVVVGSC